MSCKLNRNVVIRKIKPKRLLLKSGSQASSTDERIPKDLLYESLSTNDSDYFTNDGVINMKQIKSSRNMRIKLNVEEHPLYANMTAKQLKMYEQFVLIANSEFDEFN